MMADVVIEGDVVTILIVVLLVLLILAVLRKLF